MVSLALPQYVFRHPFRVGHVSLFINIINGLLVIWLAWHLAGLSWLLLPSPPDEGNVVVAPVLQPVQRKSATLGGSELAGWHLFGEVGQQQSTAKKASALSAPETRLRLTLKGVFANDEAAGWAIIAGPKGKEDTYGIGDPLPGGAKLSEIYVDRIILERNGRFETLKLPKSRSKSVNRSTVARLGGRNDRTRATAFSKYRKEIKQNPASFLNYVRATPARKSGKFIGFRLQPGRQRGALKELGLKPGDIVTSINGVKIDAPAKGMKAMQALGKGDSVGVTLLRGGQEISLNLTLPTSAR